MKTLVTACLVAGAMMVGATAIAAGPPLKILVGFPAGGSIDAVARIVGDHMSRTLDRPVLVEGRTGGGGQIAAVALKAAAPDGNTVMLANDHVAVILPLTMKKLDFDPVADLMPLGKVIEHTISYAVSPSAGKSLPEYATWLKANRDKASYGVPAIGSVPQFVGYMVGKQAGVELTPVPYRGAAPAAQDVVAGQIAAAVVATPDVVGLHQGGRLRILAVSGTQRAATLPDVPTFKEAGYPGLENNSWFAFFAPKGTPDAFVQQFSAALRTALQSPEVTGKLAGLEPGFSTPGELEKTIATSGKLWDTVIQASGYEKQ